jgi:hypothetical protein
MLNVPRIGSVRVTLNNFCVGPLSSVVTTRSCCARITKQALVSRSDPARQVRLGIKNPIDDFTIIKTPIKNPDDSTHTLRSQGCGDRLNRCSDLIAFTFEIRFKWTVRLVVQQCLLPSRVDTNGVQGWIPWDRMTVQIPDGTQMLETRAVRFAQITTIQNDFDFIAVLEPFRALLENLLTDFLSIQVTAFVLIVHHASETTFAMRSKTSLRGGSSDTAQAGGAAREDTGDARLEAFVQAFVVEEVSVPVGEGGESVNGWDQILRHGQIMQTFVRISIA